MDGVDGGDSVRRPPWPFLAKSAAALVTLCVVVGLVGALPEGSDPPRDAGEVRAAATTTTAPAPTATTAGSTTTSTSSTTTTAPLTPGRVGVFVPVAGQTEVIGSGSLVTYSVEVEEAVGIDPAEVGAIVDAAFADPRSWTASGSTSFQRLETGGEVQIVLATPPTTDERCAPLPTNGIFSCRVGPDLSINSDRWLNGTDDWPLGIEAYRAHVLNHEMGHALGEGHVFCSGPDQLAPVMMQQTKGLEGCQANPWPFPDQAPAAAG